MNPLGVIEAMLSPKQLFALPFVRLGISEGLSTSEMLRIFRSNGFSMANEAFFNLARYVRFENDSGGYLGQLRGNQEPDAALLPEAITRLSRQYSFTVELKGYNPLTNEETTVYRTVSTDELMTRDEIVQAAYNANLREEGTEAIIATSARVTKGLRAGELGTL